MDITIIENFLIILTVYKSSLGKHISFFMLKHLQKYEVEEAKAGKNEKLFVKHRQVFHIFCYSEKEKDTKIQEQT